MVDVTWNTMNKKYLACVFLIIASYAMPLNANDSVAMIVAGGIQLNSTKDIEMVSEDLYLSTKQIRVSYVFKNKSRQDINTIVAFPVPDFVQHKYLFDMPLRDYEPSSSTNYLNFSAIVNGKEVKLKNEARAFVTGSNTEITNLPEMQNLAWQSPNRKLYNQLKNLPEFHVNRLIKVGAIKNFGTDENPEYVPNWTTKSLFYWNQVFPANTEIKISHQYNPIVGGTIGIFTDDSVTTKYCVDSATNSGLKRLIDKMVVGNEYEFATVGYILKTGANWAGPIQDFKVTFDKESPENILSTCMTGLTKTGASTFTAHYTNYLPDRDIDFFVVRKFIR